MRLPSRRNCGVRHAAPRKGCDRLIPRPPHSPVRVPRRRIATRRRRDGQPARLPFAVRREWVRLAVPAAHMRARRTRNQSSSVRAMLAILDGTVTDASQAQIPATDDGFLRGDGVFEVMRLYGGRPFALDDHLTRLGRSAANLRLPIDLEAVRADVETLIERNDVPGRRDARGRHARRAPAGDRRGAQAAARDAGAGHDRVRADARARPGQVAVLRRQHARPPPGPGAGRRRRAARDPARPRARGPDDVVRLLAGRRDARHAAAVASTSSTRSPAGTCSASSR